jgi:thiosulfate/3-mercaptopyruvate sulfurtransferase
VSADWLRAHAGDADVRVIDARWSLAASGREAYAAGHVPGAVFVDLEADITPTSGPGRHPIPGHEQVARVFGAAGVDDDTHVVAYDDAGGSVASRVWFLLRRYGHTRVSILDGGYRAWLAAGGAVSKETPHPEPRALHLRAASGEDVVDKAYVRALGERLRTGEVLLLDARAVERYRGESEPIDARAGHIPGAKSAPWMDNLSASPDGVARFRGDDELRALYTSLGATKAKEVIVYCGSSVTSCLDIVGLERAGFGPVRVYEGSWSEWARDPALPAALGDE